MTRPARSTALELSCIRHGFAKGIPRRGRRDIPSIMLRPPIKERHGRERIRQNIGFSGRQRAGQRRPLLLIENRLTDLPWLRMYTRLAMPSLKFRLGYLLLVPFVFQWLNAQRGFVHTAGPELVDGTGKPLLLRGINLGNWFEPEGYMFHFEGGAQSPREIE